MARQVAVSSSLRNNSRSCIRKAYILGTGKGRGVSTVVNNGDACTGP